VGYVVIGIVSDNFGRRYPFLIWQAIGLIGFGLVLMAGDLFMVEVGMFLAGFGTQICFAIIFSIQKEILSNKNRQIMELLVQCFTCLGGIGVILMFYFLQDWRKIFWIFVFTPLVICCIFSVFLFKETPRYLLKLNTVQ